MANLWQTFIKGGPLGVESQLASASRARVAAAKQKLGLSPSPAPSPVSAQKSPDPWGQQLATIRREAQQKKLVPSATGYLGVASKTGPASPEKQTLAARDAAAKGSSSSVKTVGPQAVKPVSAPASTLPPAPGLPGGYDPALAQPLPTGGGMPATAGASAPVPTSPPSGAAPSAPVSPYDAARQQYLSSLSMSPAEQAATGSLGTVQAGAASDVAKAQQEYADRVKSIQEQATLQPFLTGRETQAQGQLANQLAAIQAASQAQTIPLQQQLAQAQAARELSGQQAQAQLGFLAPTPVSVAAGTSLVNPLTGQPLYQAPINPTSLPASLQEYNVAVQQGYGGSFSDYQRDTEAQKAQVSAAATPSSYREWQLAGNPGTYSDFLATKGGTAFAPGQQPPQARQFQQQTTQRITDAVDSAVSSLSPLTTGLAAAALMNIPGTPAFNFNQKLQTLKSNIAFGVLQDMRNASKTGGALGQVSDREEAMLSSVLGSLDARQSTEQLKKNLQNIKDSIQRWNDAVQSSGDETSGTASGDSSFTW